MSNSFIQNQPPLRRLKVIINYLILWQFFTCSTTHLQRRLLSCRRYPWMLISKLRKKSSQITKPDSQIIRSRHLTFNWPVIDFSACDKTQYIWGYPLPKDNLHMKQKNITMYVCGVPDPKKLTTLKRPTWKYACTN